MSLLNYYQVGRDEHDAVSKACPLASTVFFFAQMSSGAMNKAPFFKHVPFSIFFFPKRVF